MRVWGWGRGDWRLGEEGGAVFISCGGGAVILRYASDLNNL